MFLGLLEPDMDSLVRDTDPDPLIRGMVADPDPNWIRIQRILWGQWIRIPDSYSESGSRSRRAQMTHKSRKNLRNFMF
jgi:hypothetical protein